ncbi:MAG: YDG domain-containing protein [Tannerella sp.]|jgi:hypothetical protein|nr:YDG domain-containing protein [Tannerella sp.]
MKTVSKIITAVLLAATCSSHLFAQSNTIDLSVASPATSGTGWTYNDHVYTIADGANVTVTGDDAGEYRRIEIAAGATAVLTLNGATVNTPPGYNAGAIMLNSNARLTLNLAGTNSVTGPASWPAIAVNAGENAELTVQGNGRLTAQGGSNAAGIGGSWGQGAGTITILGGTIEATGSGGGSSGAGAGIGGGMGGGGGIIHISGGTVTATGSYTPPYWSGSAGIGGGTFGSGGAITISGGTVTAYSIGNSGGGAGIGGGYKGIGGSITISGGTVTANAGGVNSIGSAIGGGLDENNNGSVIITGGSVKMSNHTGPPPTGDGTNPVYLNTLTVGGLSAVTPVTTGVIGSTVCSEVPSGGSYGIRDVTTDATGKVYFYLPPTTGSEPVTLGADGAYYSESYVHPNTNNNNTATLVSTPTAVAFVPEGMDGTAQAPYDFESQEYGYSSSDLLTVALTGRVRNTGNTETGALDVTGSILMPASLPSVPVSETTPFTLQPETGLAIGTYTDTVRVTNAGGISALFTVRFTVIQKTITVSGVTATKPYDGNTTATVTGVTFDSSMADELVSGTDYTVGASSYTDNPNAGNPKPVTVTVTLESTPTADNYILSGSPYTLTGAITPKGITASGGTVTAKPYDGTTVATVTGVTFTGLLAADDPFDPTDCTVSAVYDDENADSGIPVTVTVTLNATAKAGNYSLPPTAYYLSGDIDPAALTATALTYDLTSVACSGQPQPVTVTAPAGAGAVTVMYDGQTTAPSAPGTYAVTVDVAAGTNYLALIGESLGAFTILEAPAPPTPPAPPVIYRTVTLPSFTGATTRPAPGQYMLISGNGFEFVLYPSAAYAGYTPSVTAGNAGAVCTPNGDGSYTVRIPAVRQDLTVGVTFTDPGAGTDVVERGGIWSSGNRVYVSSPRGGRATVYSLAGTVVKVFDAAAGVTVSQTLPAGVWIVVFDGQRRKAVVGE